MKRWKKEAKARKRLGLVPLEEPAPTPPVEEEEEEEEEELVFEKDKYDADDPEEFFEDGGSRN